MGQHEDGNPLTLVDESKPSKKQTHQTGEKEREINENKPSLTPYGMTVQGFHY